MCWVFERDPLPPLTLSPLLSLSLCHMAVKCDPHLGHDTGSAGRPSLHSRFQNKSHTGNSELQVTGFGAISGC